MDVEPFGFPAEDMRGGIIGATIAATVGASTEPKQFMLRPPHDEVEDDADPFEEFARTFR
jgi:hypothetical protein